MSSLAYLVTSDGSLMADATRPDKPFIASPDKAVVRVTSRAMSLTSINARGTEATTLVFCHCDWLQMTWAYACRITTKMVKFKPIENRPDTQLVSQSMSQSRSASTTVKNSIAVGRAVAAPPPTALSLFNLRPKALFNRANNALVFYARWVSIMTPAVIVHVAHSTGTLGRSMFVASGHNTELHTCDFSTCRGTRI